MGRVVVNQSAVADLHRDVGEAWQVDTKPRLSAAIVTTMPIDTGNMVLETTVEPFTDDAGRPSLRVRGKAFYTAFVDQGTGLWGPLAKYITPSKGKTVMKWVSRETGRTVYAKRTKGQPGQHFFRRAMEMLFDHVEEHPFGK